MRSLKILKVMGLTAVLTVGGTVAHSHVTGIPEADHRIEKMQELGKNMKAIAEVAKGKSAFSPALNDNAHKINAIAQEMAALFPVGSGGEKTRSKSEIWSKSVDFDVAVSEFKTAAAALVKSVASGQQAVIGQALQATGKTCGGCHKPFRTPKKDH